MLGSNVSTVGGLINGIKNGERWRCDCIQSYITPSRTWRVKPFSKGLIHKFKARMEKSGIKRFVSHVPFLLNLASVNEGVRTRSQRRLEQEIKMAVDLGVELLVLHPGSHGTGKKKNGIKKIVSALNTAIQKYQDCSFQILLETMAGQGTALGSSFEEMNTLVQGIQSQDHIGVCFDTAHVFIAGYPFTGYEGYEEVLEEFDEIVGIDQIKTIHLNDAKTEMGSQNDRHAAIGEGKMGLRVFHALMRDPRFENTPKILEIPERDEKSEKILEFLRLLQKKRPPVEDFPEKTLSGTRRTQKKMDEFVK